MCNINIILYFDNTKYTELLARGLCYESTGLNVFFAKHDLICYNTDTDTKEGAEVL